MIARHHGRPRPGAAFGLQHMKPPSGARKIGREAMPASALNIAGLAAVFAMALAAHAHAATADGHDAFSGVWMIEHPVTAVKAVDSHDPPLLPEARKVYESHLAARRAGDTSYDSVSWCAGAGVPRLMFAPYPFELLVQPRRVAFLYQWNHWARTVDMAAKQLDVPYPISIGIAVGHWEGATLIIETTGLRDSTLLDSAGLPHSDEMKLTERLRLLGPDRLEDRITIDDAKTFSRPWRTAVTYRRKPEGAVIKEDVCLDRIKKGEPAIR